MRHALFVFGCDDEKTGVVGTGSVQSLVGADNNGAPRGNGGVEFLFIAARPVAVFPEETDPTRDEDLVLLGGAGRRRHEMCQDDEV